MGRKFRDNESGSIALMFALVMTCILIICAVCVDYASVSKKKAELQHVADSAVLAAATSGKTQQSELQEIALAVGQENFKGDLIIRARIVDDRVRVIARHNHSYMFASVFGKKDNRLRVVSESLLPSSAKLNLAMALDITASMEGARMTALKDAATTLVRDIAAADAGRGNANISLIPFADYVRIDMDYEGENWLNIEAPHDESWEVLDEDASTNCVQVGSGEYKSTECEVEVFKTVSALIEWYGCMVSRPNGYHKTPEFGSNRMQGNAGHSSCGGGYGLLMPLSDDFNELENQIQALTPIGKTYMPAGLIWAWRTLDKREPFTQAASEDRSEALNTILLMTDGSNTTHLNGSSHTGFDGIYHWPTGDQPHQIAADKLAADTLTAELCVAIKSANIKIVTVAFQVTDPTTKAMLRTCASSNQDYYDAVTAEELKTAFKDIGSGAADVRLVK